MARKEYGSLTKTDF